MSTTSPTLSYTDSSQSPTKINRWVFVIVGFISMIVGVNTVTVLWNVLGANQRAELGWSPSLFSIGLSIFIVFDGISNFALGYLADRYGIRRVSIILAALFGLSMAALGFTTPNTVTFIALCVLMGSGCGAATQAAYSIVIRAWFANHRGLAMGILAAGLGLCTTIMPLVAAGLQSAFGWRATYIIIGLLATVILVGGYTFIARMPADYERERKTALAERRTPGLSFAQVVRDVPRAFWLITISIFLLSAGTAGVLGQIVPLATGQGASAAVGIAMLSASGISSIAARFVVGYLLDRVFAPLLSAIVFAICGLGLVLLVTTHSVPILFLGAILVGIGPGAETDVIGYIVSRYVPEHSYGRIYGFIVFIYALGVALGIFMLGQSIAITGNAYFAAWTIVGMVAVSAILILFVGPYHYRVDGSLEGSSPEVKPIDEGSTV